MSNKIPAHVFESLGFEIKRIRFSDKACICCALNRLTLCKYYACRTADAFNIIVNTTDMIADKEKLQILYNIMTSHQ